MIQPDINTLMDLRAKSDLLDIVIQLLLKKSPETAFKIIQDLRNSSFEEDFLQKATVKFPDDLGAAKAYLISRSRKLDELESICNAILIKAQSSLPS